MELTSWNKLTRPIRGFFLTVGSTIMVACASPTTTPPAQGVPVVRCEGEIPGMSIQGNGLDSAAEIGRLTGLNRLSVYEAFNSAEVEQDGVGLSIDQEGKVQPNGLRAGSMLEFYAADRCPDGTRQVDN